MANEPGNPESGFHEPSHAERKSGRTVEPRHQQEKDPRSILEEQAGRKVGRGMRLRTRLAAGLAALGLAAGGGAAVGAVAREVGHHGSETSHSRVIDKKAEKAKGGYDADVRALKLNQDESARYVVNPEQVAHSYKDVLNSVNTALNNVDTGQQLDIPLSSGGSLVSELDKYQKEGQSGMREHLVRTVGTDSDGLYGQGSTTIVDNISLGEKSSIVASLPTPDMIITTVYNKNKEDNGIGGTQDASTYDQQIDFRITPDGKIVVGGTSQDVHLSREDILQFASKLGYTEITADTNDGVVFAGAYDLQVGHDGSAEFRSSENYMNDTSPGLEYKIPNPDTLTKINSESELASALALNLSQQTDYGSQEKYAERQRAISAMPDLSAESKLTLFKVNKGVLGKDETADKAAPAAQAYTDAGKSAA